MFWILIGGIEYLHHREYGHFVSYGLHVDTLNRDADIGIPGQTKMYWLRLSNYTLWPVKLAACDYISLFLPLPTKTSLGKRLFYQRRLLFKIR